MGDSAKEAGLLEVVTTTRCGVTVGVSPVTFSLCDGDGYLAYRGEPLLPEGNRECPRCHGEGSITYNPSRILDPQEERDARCPDCHGTGTLPSESK